MQYDVYIGDITLYGVTDVKGNSERDIESYDGIGKGTFSVAGSKELRIWDIQCELSENNDHHHSDWTSAQSIFDAFEQMLADESEQRLVISSEDNNISELALLKSYTKTEKEYQGVYDVSIRLMEYVPVSVRTTDVPYGKRPGKVPVPPTVTFNGGTVTPYSVAQGLGMAGAGMAGISGGSSGVAAAGAGAFVDPQTGKPYNNPCLIPDNEPVAVQFWGGLGEGLGSLWDSALGGYNTSGSDTGRAIGETIGSVSDYWVGKAFEKVGEFWDTATSAGGEPPDWMKPNNKK
jgi:hypothetical protein